MTEELDYQWLDRELDRTKTQVFLGKNAAFLGSIMCSLNFMWTTEFETAATNGINLFWNPHYFKALCPKGRISILVHELWHVALLHMLRRETRDSRIWNMACDTVLDNMMDLDGYIVDERLFPQPMFPPGTEGFLDHATYGTMPAEEIYDLMVQDPPEPLWANQDLVEPGEGEKDSINHAVVNIVVAAHHAGMLAGDVPGSVTTLLNKFLQPKLPWEQLLQNFFSELGETDYSWARPNRRHPDVYLPGLVDKRSALEHVMYFEDASGSISDGDSTRFNSEFKYIKEQFQPEKLTKVQFDTKIQKVDVFLKEDPFEEIVVVGRGGTSLVCVRDYIIEHRPTAVVVFSDLYCEPMELLPPNLNIPIIWVCLNNVGAVVNQGQLVHLRE